MHTSEPAPTPGPAATPLASSSPRPASQSSKTPASLLSPAVQPFLPTGRSKEVRWWDDSPGSVGLPFGRSPSARPSYRDMVLSSSPSAVESSIVAMLPSPALSLAPVPHARCVSHRWVPRQPGPPPYPMSTALHGVFPSSAPVSSTGARGWMLVEGRHARRSRHRQPRRPRNPVPMDLEGKCFNCFSLSHRVAQCWRSTRCFRCKSLGHHAFECVHAPTSLLASPLAYVPPRSVWSRLSLSAASSSSAVSVSRFFAISASGSLAGGVSEAGSDHGGSGSRPCRRSRRRRRLSVGASTIQHLPPPSPSWDGSGPRELSPARLEMTAFATATINNSASVCCVLDRSESIVKAEADLRRRFLSRSSEPDRWSLQVTRWLKLHTNSTLLPTPWSSTVLIRKTSSFSCRTCQRWRRSPMEVG
ncbi:uncharacterized protein LOC133919306 [Phragmites australis]|uniref:uncharacterized protein LOC133919306 n=1 Tax=Phragmites australis TaxID=29695 RepID=UPI002D767E2F|nr:uncharacterized protein LOC133919306 [Phragmites australis]